MPSVAQSDPGRRIRRARRLIFAATSVALLLGLEVGLRALGFPRFDACRPNDEAPWQADGETFIVLRPNSEIGIGRTNSLGLRGPELPEERTPGIARVLFVGDSTCWGVGVALEDTFAVRSAHEAARAIGRPIEIVNGCIPGHSSFQSRAMQARLLRFSPDAVVYYVGARNDVDRHRYFRDAEIPVRLARRQKGWHRVRLLQAGEAAFDGLYKKLLRKPLSRERRARVPPADFAGNVEAMLRQAEAAHARKVILMPPWSVSLIERYPTIPKYQRILEEAATTSGATLVALQPTFRLYAEESVYQADRLHFNRPGHELAAHELASALVSALERATAGSPRDMPIQVRAR